MLRREHEHLESLKGNLHRRPLGFRRGEAFKISARGNAWMPGGPTKTYSWETEGKKVNW